MLFLIEFLIGLDLGQQIIGELLRLIQIVSAKGKGEVHHTPLREHRRVLISLS